MSETKRAPLPSGGGSFIVTPQGELERLEGTIGAGNAAHPDRAQTPAAPAATPAQEPDKPGKTSGSKGL